MNRKYLGEFEEVVILTIAILLEEAYGVAIREDLKQRLERNVSLGALHATLVRLEDKGYLSSQMGEATQKRGGRRKRYYEVTQAGKAALRESKETRNSLWDAIPEASFDISF